MQVWPTRDKLVTNTSPTERGLVQFRLERTYDDRGMPINTDSTANPIPHSITKHAETTKGQFALCSTSPTYTLTRWPQWHYLWFSHKWCGIFKRVSRVRNMPSLQSCWLAILRSLTTIIHELQSICPVYNITWNDNSVHRVASWLVFHWHDQYSMVLGC